MTDRTKDLTAMIAGLARCSPEQRIAQIEEMEWSSDLYQQLCDELDRLALSDLNAALNFGESLVRVVEASDDLRAIARVKRSWAQVLAYANRFEESLEQVRASLDVARQAGCTTEAARAQLTSLHALARLGRYDEAIEHGEAARQVFAELNETKLLARASANLGVTHRMRDDPARALEYFDEAIELLADDPMATAQLYSNRAEALLDLHRFVEAEVAFKTSRQLFGQIGAQRAVAIVEGNLADLTSRQGRLEEALAHFERAAELFEDAAAPGDLARLRAEQAEAFAAAGAWAEAIELYERAIGSLRQHGLAWETARALAGLGEALTQAGRFTDAEQCFSEAEERFNVLGHKTYSARIQMQRGNLAMLNGRSQDAQQLFIQALTLLEPREQANGGTFDAATASHRLGRLAMLDGDLLAAEAFINEAAGVIELRHHAPALSELLQTRANLRYAQGNTIAAIDDLRQAVTEIDRVRGVLPIGRLRASYLGHRIDAYSRLVSMLLDEQTRRADCQAHEYVHEAFHVVELSRCRVLLDMMSGVIVQSMPGSDDRDRLDANATIEVTAEPRKVSDEVVQLRRELNALYSRVDVLEQFDEPTADDERPLKQIEQRERALALAESRLAVTSGLGDLFARPADLGEIVSAIPADAALVEYFAAGDSICAFVVRDGRLHVQRDLTDSASLQEICSQFDFQISRALVRIATATSTGETSGPEQPSFATGLNDLVNELGLLHDTLMRPLMSLLEGVTRLVIVPSGPLHMMPFPAFFDRECGRYLVELFDVTAVPSASVLVRIKLIEPSINTPLIVGVPDEHAPSIEEEVHRLQSTLPQADVLFAGQATSSRVIEQMPGRGLIHLACHGRFSALQPMGSGLRLADRWLTVREIFDLDLRGATVTLSACETGRSDVAAGEELLGLVRGFLAAGASRLLISLWPLNDETAQKIMATAYDLWQNGGRGAKRASHPQRRYANSFATALAEAQRMMIRAKLHPALWAPIMLIGRD